jgi:hypothetical protein
MARLEKLDAAVIKTLEKKQSVEEPILTVLDFLGKVVKAVTTLQEDVESLRDELRAKSIDTQHNEQVRAAKKAPTKKAPAKKAPAKKGAAKRIVEAKEEPAKASAKKGAAKKGGKAKSLQEMKQSIQAFVKECKPEGTNGVAVVRAALNEYEAETVDALEPHQQQDFLDRIQAIREELV